VHIRLAAAARLGWKLMEDVKDVHALADHGERGGPGQSVWPQRDVVGRAGTHTRLANLLGRAGLLCLIATVPMCGVGVRPGRFTFDGPIRNRANDQVAQAAHWQRSMATPPQPR
jgi:hypothetical protein